MAIVIAEKKPLEIEAMYHDGTKESAVKIVAWIQSYADEEETLTGVTNQCDYDREFYSVYVTTLGGDMYLHKEWWLIRGIHGELYPCRDSIFKETYNIKRYKSQLDF